MTNLGIDLKVVQDFNTWINEPQNPYIRQIRSLLNKYGTVEQINAKAREAKTLANRMDRLRALGADQYVKDLEWLAAQRDLGTFVSIEEYRKRVLGEKYKTTFFPETNAVILEISSLHYFDWMMDTCRIALENRSLVPSRYICIRPLRDVELTYPGELIAIQAAMDIIGATHCTQMDTTGKNTGANIHACNPKNYIGWLGGSGTPNEHVLMWIDELLYYYTTYGISEILNVTPGTQFAIGLLYRMGIDVTMKGSVLMGVDNAYHAITALLITRMFARENGDVPMVGLNPSDSVNAQTMQQLADIRMMLGLENRVRIEQHVTNFYEGVVQQPFMARDLLIESAKTIPYMSAKHEAADPEVEAQRPHPTSNFDFTYPDEKVRAEGLYEPMREGFLYGIDEANKTADELTKRGMSFVAATNLHRRF